MTLGWKANNDENYYSSLTTNKVLTCDPADDVIDFQSSLMTGIALKAAQNTFGKKVSLENHSFVISKKE